MILNNLKGHLFLLIAGISMTMGLTACTSDDGEEEWRIWDFAPINYKISIEDTNGIDLLDSVTVDNLRERISIVFNGTEYTPFLVDANTTDSMLFYRYTRAYLTHFYGPVIEREYEQPIFYLTFGEFDGHKNYELNEIDLMLDDKKLCHLSFTNSFKWLSVNNPEIVRHFYFNDKEQDDTSYGRFRLRLTAEGEVENLPYKDNSK